MPVSPQAGMPALQPMPALQTLAPTGPRCYLQLADLLSPFSPRETGRKTYNYGASSSHPTALVTFQTGNSLPDRSSIMKKFTALVLFCSFALAMAQTASSQSRPRRVGSTPPPQQQPQQMPSSQPTPEPDSTELARPNRP